jgi:FdhE protein
MTDLEDARWEKRIARARTLADDRPAVAEPLRFYAALATLQKSLPLQAEWPGIAPLTPAFVDDLNRVSPPAIADKLRTLTSVSEHHWATLIDTYWTSGGREPTGVDELRLFVVEAILQPFAEVQAYQTAAPRQRTADTRCPHCTGAPTVGVLREEGHGARRSLLCGICLTEWPSARLMCAACDESGFESLPVFRAEEFDAIRVDVCESCQTYMKTVDLTKDGAALPIVDDIASLPLDLWARDKGYRRARPNVLRL